MGALTSARNPATVVTVVSRQGQKTSRNASTAITRPGWSGFALRWRANAAGKWTKSAIPSTMTTTGSTEVTILICLPSKPKMPSITNIATLTTSIAVRVNNALRNTHAITANSSTKPRPRKVLKSFAVTSLSPA